MLPKWRLKAGIWLAPDEAKTIKLADLIHNTESIVQNDPGFARTYLKEKLLTLQGLRGGDPTLMVRALQLTANGFETIFKSSTDL